MFLHMANKKYLRTTTMNKLRGKIEMLYLTIIRRQDGIQKESSMHCRYILYTCMYMILFIGTVSRHTVMCRAAQEAGAQPREYIDRKKENAIFAPP